MTADPFAGAGVTALGLAAARAVESGRLDRLIDDPHARVLFEAAGSDLPMRTQWPADGEGVSDTEALHLHGSRYIGLRTRFYDDALIAAAASGTRQAVLLGAGLDTRAWRLGLPVGFRLYEIDRPELLAYKHEAMAGRGSATPVVAVGADLAGDWTGRLLAAEFDAERPTAWVAEGLLPYLPSRARHELLDAVGELSAPGSTLALDHVVGGDVAELSQRSGIDMDALLGGTEERMADRLADAGWSTSTSTADELGRRYGRDLADPFATDGSKTAPPWLMTEFVEAVAVDSRAARSTQW